MNYLIKGILENYAGEEAVSCLSSLCEAATDFLEPEDVYISNFDDQEIEEEFIRAVQQKFESDYQLVDYLVETEKAEIDYVEGFYEIYLEYDYCTKSFRFNECVLQEMLGEDLVEDYEELLDKFINKINHETTLKVLRSGNHTA